MIVVRRIIAPMHLQREDVQAAARVLAELTEAGGSIDRLRTLARIRGLSLKQVADAAGIAYPRLEAGLNGRRALRAEEIAAITEALGVELPAESPGAQR